MVNINKYAIALVMLFFVPAAWAQEKVWTLEDCINYALNENIQVKQAELGNEQAQLNYELKKASRHPSAQASISQNIGWSKSLDENGNYGSFKSNDQTNISLSSSLTLFNGSKLQNQVKQSEFDLQSNAYYTQVVKESIELSILNAFLQVLYAQENVENGREQIDLTLEQMNLAEERLALKAISRADYLQIKSELASEKLTLADAESQLILAKVSLMQFMELPADSVFSIALPNIDTILNENRIPDVSYIYNSALNTKPEISQAELNEKSAMLDEKIAKSDLYPSLSLNTGVGTNYTVSNPNFTYVELLSNQVNPYVGLSLSIPIYQRKQVKTNIGLSRIGARQAQLNTINTKNTLRKEVEQASANVIIAQQQFEASVEDFDVATESVKIANEKFDLGLINSVDFLFEKTAYIMSESTLLQNKYKLIFNYKILDYYRGLPITL